MVKIMSRSNSTKVSSRFFNSNNHSLPVTFYNKFSTSSKTTFELGQQQGFVPDSRSIIYPPTNVYYWKGAAWPKNNDLDKQRLASWWPIQTLENDYLVLRWTSLTTKDYKFDSTLTKTRVATRNSAEISQWHYPKMVAPGFSYAVWGREFPEYEVSPPPAVNPSSVWTKYGVVKDEPGGVMEFVFNDKYRKLDDFNCFINGVESRVPFQWMITIENSNYEPPPTYGFSTGNVSVVDCVDTAGQFYFPIFQFVDENYFGYSQWVVAMSPWRRDAPVTGNYYQGQQPTISYRVNGQWGGWENLNVVLTNRTITSADTPGGLTPYLLTFAPSTNGANIYVIGDENEKWDNTSANGKSLGWLEDVLNFAGREIETKNAFKGFNGESISALHHLDTSNNTDFSSMFENCPNFNQDIGFLDFSNAATMENMFNGADKYMQDMSGWNTA
jgi:hypothetical protein